MPWGFCFKLRKKGEIEVDQSRNICVDIPILIDRGIPPRPPVLTSKLIKESFVKDLQVLATIDQLATLLSGGLKKHIQDTVRRSAKDAGELPADWELNFGGGSDGEDSAYTDKD